MTAVNERTTISLSLLGGAFVIGSSILGVAWRQETRASGLETSIAFVARDVSDIKVQIADVKTTLIDRVTVDEMEAWIRLNNATNPTYHLQGFRK